MAQKPLKLKPRLDFITPSGHNDSSTSLKLSPQVTGELIIDGKSYHFSLKDLEEQEILGEGTFGKVSKYLHTPSNKTVAVKKVRIQMDKSLIQELSVLEEAMKNGKCEFVVSFFGSLKSEGEVLICMEIMKISMDKISTLANSKHVQIPQPNLQHIAYCIVQALNYVKTALNVIHRDVKPSNMLVGEKGEVKLCDFGISGPLIDSIAKTHEVGCRPFMAPERLNPDKDQGYTIHSDVWSFGISMFEMSTGNSPYGEFKNFFDQVNRVVNGDPPQLPNDCGYDDTLIQFVNSTLKKNYKDRPNYTQLLEDPFLAGFKPNNDAMAAWIATIEK